MHVGSEMITSQLRNVKSRIFRICVEANHSSLREAGGDVGGDLLHLGVDTAVGDEDFGVAGMIGAAGKIGDHAAGFRDDQHSGSGVPRFEAEFPKSVEASAGQRTQIERGGAVAAHAVRAQRVFPVVGNVEALAAPVSGKARGDEARSEFFDGRDVDALVLEPGAFATDGREEFAGDGIEDSADQRLARFEQADRDGEAGIAVREVGGAVERIHVPAEASSGCGTSAALLGHYGMAGKMAAQAADDQRFRAAVGFGDDVHLALVRNILRAAEIRGEQRASFACGVNGDFEVVVHRRMAVLFSFRRGGREILAAITDCVAALHAQLHVTKRAGRRRRVGIIAQQILGAQLAINAIENRIELVEFVEDEKISAGAVHDGDQGVLAGRVAAVLVFHRADDHGVEKSFGGDGPAARVFEFRNAGGFARVGDEHDGAAAVRRAAAKRLRGKHDGVVHRGARARRDFSRGGLERGNVFGKVGELSDCLSKLEDAQRITGANNLADEMPRGFRFEFQVLVRAQAGVHHQREIERTVGLRFEPFDFLRNAFFLQLESVLGEVGDGPAARVDHRGVDVDEIDLNANTWFLLLIILLRRGR